jgi:Fe-S cluster assembly iron-binding protein IscA
MEQENVDPGKGGLQISVQPGGCSGFKYGLLIEDEAAEDDLVVGQE